MVYLERESQPLFSKEKVIAIGALILVIAGLSLLYMNDQWAKTPGEMDAAKVEMLNQQIQSELQAVQNDLKEVQEIVIP